MPVITSPATFPVWIAQRDAGDTEVWMEAVFPSLEMQVRYLFESGIAINRTTAALDILAETYAAPVVRTSGLNQVLATISLTPPSLVGVEVAVYPAFTLGAITLTSFARVERSVTFDVKVFAYEKPVASSMAPRQGASGRATPMSIYLIDYDGKHTRHGAGLSTLLSAASGDIPFAAKFACSPNVSIDASIELSSTPDERTNILWVNMIAPPLDLVPGCEQGAPPPRVLLFQRLSRVPGCTWP